MTITLHVFLLFLPILLIWVGRALKCFLSERRRRNELAARIYGPPAHPLLGHLPIFPKCQYGLVCDPWGKWFIASQNGLTFWSIKAMRRWQRAINWSIGGLLGSWLFGRWMRRLPKLVWFIYDHGISKSVKVILEHSTELKKGRDYDFYKQWLGQGLLLSDGQRWREQRKTLTPTFHFTMLEQYMTVFNRQAKENKGRELCQNW